MQGVDGKTAIGDRHLFPKVRRSRVAEKRLKKGKNSKFVIGLEMYFACTVAVV